MSDFFLPSAGGTRSPKVSSVQALRHDWLEFPVVAVAFSGPAVGDVNILIEPLVDHDLGLRCGGEPFGIELIVAESASETLVLSVLPR